MAEDIAFEWRGVRVSRGRRMASLWVYKGGAFHKAFVGKVLATETEEDARGRFERFARASVA